MKINLAQYKIECKRCGHRWIPRKADVRICPKCKSALWDIPRKESKMKIFEELTGSKAREAIEKAKEQLAFYDAHKEDKKALEEAGLGYYEHFNSTDFQNGYKVFHLRESLLKDLQEEASSSPEELIREQLLKDQHYQGFRFDPETRKYLNPELDAKVKELAAI